MGAIVSFYPNPNKAVVGCVPQPGAVRHAGTVIGTFPVPPLGPGKIPDLGLLVRGRSKQKKRIAVCEHYAETHGSFKEADATNDQAVPRAQSPK
jgi:hypothetical protein